MRACTHVRVHAHATSGQHCSTPTPTPRPREHTSDASSALDAPLDQRAACCVSSTCRQFLTSVNKKVAATADEAPNFFAYIKRVGERDAAAAIKPKKK